MKLFVCTDHDQHYPVGCASVVLATGVKEARKLLDEQLARAGLATSRDKPYTLSELLMSKPTAIILCDGNY